MCVNNFIDSYDNQCVCTYMLNGSDILAFFTAHATTSVCVGEPLQPAVAFLEATEAALHLGKVEQGKFV